jgi:hypothetical protein
MLHLIQKSKPIAKHRIGQQNSDLCIGTDTQQYKHFLTLIFLLANGVENLKVLRLL